MICVIDYGVGNLFSVEKALLQFSDDVKVTHDKSDIEAADKLVLPGVGDFGECMKNLQDTGLIPTIMKKIENGTPILGICIGMQIMFEGSEESPNAKGLGLFKGMVRHINAPALKVPHMGWNSLDIVEPRPALYEGLSQQPYTYFVHSYHAVPEDKSIITATAEYGETLTAAVGKGNVMATQFHPEKSGDVGLQILKNFIEM